jgi:hypothetical protein
MNRNAKSLCSRRATRLAAVAGASLLLAGCGASGASSTSSTTPPVSTTTGAGQFDPGLVPTTSTTTTTTSTTSTRHKAKARPAKGKAAGKPSGGSTSSPSSSSAGSGGSGGTHTITITRTITVTQVHTRTVAAAAPSVPGDAHPPSAQAALGFTHFTIPGGDIGCAMYGDAARCDVARRSWSPPARPHSCGLDWGQGLEVGSSGTGQFVCAGDSVLDPTGDEVANGLDDRVGSDTCQVRSSTVTCFDSAGNGFMIAATGYETF